MRFAGAISVLTFCVGSTALAQSAVDREQRITELQKQLDSIAAQLRELQDGPAAGSTSLESRLDGAIRQSPSETLREPRRLNISAPGLEGLDITGNVRVRGEVWNDYDRGANGDSTGIGSEAALGFNAKVSEKSHVYLEPHAAFVWGDNTVHNLVGGPIGTGGGTAPNNSFFGNANSDVVVITQAYLSVADIYGSGWNMTAGRERVELGAERMIGDDEWSLNRTTFDGFRLDRNLGEPGNVTVLAMRLKDPIHGTDYLGNANSPEDTHGELYGVYYSSQKNDQAGQFDVYLLHLEDENFQSGTPGDRTRWTTYGARWRTPSFGGLVVDAEAATQFGEYFGQDTNHDVGGDVWAFHADATYKAENVEFIDGFCVGYDYATGGDDVNNRHSFVQLYPSLHGWFGITDFFGWSNIIHFMAGASFKVEHGKLMLSYHRNRMASGEGGFVGYNNFGGSSRVNGGGKDLGHEFDLVYSVDCTKSTAVDLGIAYFLPEDGYTASVGGGKDNMTFGYLQFRTRF